MKGTFIKLGMIALASGIVSAGKGAKGVTTAQNSQVESPLGHFGTLFQYYSYSQILNE